MSNLESEWNKNIGEPSYTKLVPAQLDLYTHESLHSKEIFSFNPQDLINQLQISAEQQVIGIDIGGSTISAARYTVVAGKLHEVYEYEGVKGRNEGVGFLDVLKEISKTAEENNLPVGLSIAGTLDGTKLKKNTATKIGRASCRERV